MKELDIDKQKLELKSELRKCDKNIEKYGLIQQIAPKVGYNWATQQSYIQKGGYSIDWGSRKTEISEKLKDLDLLEKEKEKNVVIKFFIDKLKLIPSLLVKLILKIIK